MFDLPVGDKAERKEAAKFRNFLLKDGFYMMQFSVYVRICNSLEAAQMHLNRVQASLPREGSVRALIITENQFTNMKVLCGERNKDFDKNQQDDLITVI